MEENNIITSTEAAAIDQIKEIANISTPAHTPVKVMEESLAKFLQDTFIMAKEEDDYQKQIKNQVITKLPDFKPSELIALITSASTNKNDLISKLVAPMMQLLTAAQQNELAQKQQQNNPNFQQFSQTNIKELNTQTPSDILAGLQSLTWLAEAVKKKEDVLATSSEN